MSPTTYQALILCPLPLNILIMKSVSNQHSTMEMEKPSWRNLTKEMESDAITRENIRKFSSFVNPKEINDSTLDAIDWHEVHDATMDQVSKAINQRGMDKKLNFIKCLLLEQENVDLIWLRELEPEKAKEFLLSIHGLGVKSVECIRFLTLQHQAFPVDTNVGRVLVRLGWIPIQPLPRGQEMHLLNMYPDVKDVHKYLWPRLCTLDYLILYEFHHQMITFGKAECRHFGSSLQGLILLHYLDYINHILYLPIVDVSKYILPEKLMDSSSFSLKSLQ
uniref:HhH-GPD domain-containing protein n=1 Tax=Solanum lycopersicum TaxID=4081 RepID=K4BRL0_SOLLC